MVQVMISLEKVLMALLSEDCSQRVDQVVEDA